MATKAGSRSYGNIAGMPQVVGALVLSPLSCGTKVRIARSRPRTVRWACLAQVLRELGVWPKTVGLAQEMSGSLADFEKRSSSSGWSTQRGR